MLSFNIRIGRNFKDPLIKFTDKYYGIVTGILLLFILNVAV